MLAPQYPLPWQYTPPVTATHGLLAAMSPAPSWPTLLAQLCHDGPEGGGIPRRLFLRFDDYRETAPLVLEDGPTMDGVYLDDCPIPVLVRHSDDANAAWTVHPTGVAAVMLAWNETAIPRANLYAPNTGWTQRPLDLLWRGFNEICRDANDLLTRHATVGGATHTPSALALLGRVLALDYMRGCGPRWLLAELSAQHGYWASRACEDAITQLWRKRRLSVPAAYHLLAQAGAPSMARLRPIILETSTTSKTHFREGWGVYDPERRLPIGIIGHDFHAWNPQPAYLALGDTSIPWRDRRGVDRNIRRYDSMRCAWTGQSILEADPQIVGDPYDATQLATPVPLPGSSEAAILLPPDQLPSLASSEFVRRAAVPTLMAIVPQGYAHDPRAPGFLLPDLEARRVQEALDQRRAIADAEAAELAARLRAAHDAAAAERARRAADPASLQSRGGLSTDERRILGMSVLRRFAETHGHCNPPRGHLIDGIDLWKWTQNVTMRYRQATIPAEYRAELDTIPGWTQRVAAATARAALRHRERAPSSASHHA